MNVKRLQLLVTMLNEVLAGSWKPAKIKLDLSDKIFEPKDQQFDLHRWFEPTPKVDCGFTACAMGHAGLDSRFRKMGLKLNKDAYGFGMTYNDFDGFDAVNAFFDFDGDIVCEEQIPFILFLGQSYPQHLKGDALIIQVIRRIEKLIEMGDEQFFNFFQNKKSYFESASNRAEHYLISKAGRLYKV